MVVNFIPNQMRNPLILAEKGTFGACENMVDAADITVPKVIHSFFFTQQKSYRPVATLSTAGAMAALIDVRAMPGAAAAAAAGPNGPGAAAANDEATAEDKQRRLLLLQAQKAKLLAAAQHSRGGFRSNLMGFPDNGSGGGGNGGGNEGGGNDSGSGSPSSSLNRKQGG